MAKFIYKMANVLDIKLKMEDQAKSAFAEAMGRLNEEEAKLQLLGDRLAFYENQGREFRRDTVDVANLRDNKKALDNIKGQISMQEDRVASARRGVERARLKLTEAMQERQTHEKLRENAFEEFKREINAAESKEVDELVSYRFGQKAIEEATEGVLHR